MQVHLKFVNMNSADVAEQYELSVRRDPHHIGDSGLDLYVAETVTIRPGKTGLLRFGVAAEAFNEGKPQSFWLIPRSSISKTPLRMANSIGLIDAGYRGELLAAVDNTSESEYCVKAGTRLFQIAAPSLLPIDAIIVDQLSDTTRGTGGFGSTGQ